MNQGRNTTQEERIQIAREYIAAGKNYGETALKYQVSCQQTRTWTRRFEEQGEAGLEGRRGKRKKDQKPRGELEKAQIEIEQLQHKLYLAEMERYPLKNWTRSKGGMPIAGKAGTREFHAAGPNEKWLTDATEFKRYEGVDVHRLYLGAVLDLYDRRIVSFSKTISTTMHHVYNGISAS